MKKSLLIPILIMIVLTVGTTLISEAAREPALECSRPGYQQTYFGWDDDLGPCTYPQRVVSLALTYIFTALFFLWPLTFSSIGFIVYKLIKQRKLKRDDWNIIGTGLLPLITLIFVVQIFFLIFG